MAVYVGGAGNELVVSDPDEQAGKRLVPTAQRGCAPRASQRDRTTPTKHPARPRVTRPARRLARRRARHRDSLRRARPRCRRARSSPRRVAELAARRLLDPGAPDHVDTERTARWDRCCAEWEDRHGRRPPAAAGCTVSE